MSELTLPKIKVAPVAAGEDAAQYLNSLTDQGMVGAYMDFYIAACGLPPNDPELLELIRIRNGVAQSCQYCLSVRLEGGYDLDRDTEHVVTHFEQSDLSDRTKAALRLAAAYLTVPSELSQEARDAALKHFTVDEIVGLMLRLTSFLINKPRAALGIDRAKSSDGLTAIDSGAAVQEFIPK